VLGDVSVGPSADPWVIGCILYAFVARTGRCYSEIQFERSRKLTH
jgi:hypothetical protein